MERLPSSQLDVDSAGILVANFLQSWWQAGLAWRPQLKATRRVMNSKIQIRHRQKMAYVYLRQSTMAQVYHHHLHPSDRDQRGPHPGRSGYSLPASQILIAPACDRTGRSLAPALAGV